MKKRLHSTTPMPLVVSLVSIVGLITKLIGADDQPNEESKTPRRTGIEFESFGYILDNNIFDSNRQDRERLEAERRRSQQRSIPVDRFALVGTMHNEGEAYAFFTGSDRDFQSVLNIGQEIAGYTVRSITKQHVDLERDGERIEFHIGMEMTRKGSEDWTLVENSRSDWSNLGGSTRASRSPSSSDSPASKSTPLSGDKSDILKKMMERRKQQMNQ